MRCLSQSCVDDLASMLQARASERAREMVSNAQRMLDAIRHPNRVRDLVWVAARGWWEVVMKVCMDVLYAFDEGSVLATANVVRVGAACLAADVAWLRGIGTMFEVVRSVLNVGVYLVMGLYSALRADGGCAAAGVTIRAGYDEVCSHVRLRMAAVRCRENDDVLVPVYDRASRALMQLWCQELMSREQCGVRGGLRGSAGSLPLPSKHCLAGRIADYVLSHARAHAHAHARSDCGVQLAVGTLRAYVKAFKDDEAEASAKRVRALDAIRAASGRTSRNTKDDALAFMPECPVCFDPMATDTVAVLMCCEPGDEADGPFHTLCRKCWKAVKPACPLCRANTRLYKPAGATGRRSNK
jgi:hypothetical protein